LDGDATGGGHRFPGSPGHDPFPQDWSDGQIMHAVSDVAADPASTWTQQTGPDGSYLTSAGNPARFLVEGTSGGLRISVIVEPAGEGIITAWPTK
jgi:hypothetical protein